MAKITPKFLMAAGGVVFLAGCTTAQGPQTTPQDIAKEREPEQCMSVTVTDEAYKEKFNKDCADAIQWARLAMTAYELAKKRGEEELFLTFVNHWNDMKPNFKKAQKETIVAEMKSIDPDIPLNEQGLNIFAGLVTREWDCTPPREENGKLGIQCFEKTKMRDPESTSRQGGSPPKTKDQSSPGVS